MKRKLNYLLVVVLLFTVFIPLVKVDAVTITQKPEVTYQLKSSDNGIYSYDIGLKLDDFLLPAEEGETPYCLIDGWILYEKVNNEYKEIYSIDNSSVDFESLYSIEVKSGETRTFAVKVFTESGAYSDYSDAVTLDHRVLTTVVTKIANGKGCFSIKGEGLDDYICGEKNTGRNTYQVPAGTQVTVKAFPAENNSFDGWYVFDTESDKISVVVQSNDIEYTFTAYDLAEGDVNTIAPAFFETYKVIEGADQTYVIDNNTEAKFRIDADYSLFKDGGIVYVDDNEVDPSNYTSASGSTIITLKKEYVDTLSEGTHTLTVLFNDNKTATTTFNVKKDTSNNETNTDTKTSTGINPKTDDNILIYFLILISSILGISGTIKYRKNII